MALVELHLSIVLLPETVVAGKAVSVTVGSAAVEVLDVTVNVPCAIALSLFRENIIVYEPKGVGTCESFPVS